MSEEISDENHHVQSKVVMLVSVVHISVQQEWPCTEHDLRFSNSHVVEGMTGCCAVLIDEMVLNFSQLL
jgi:hypothetical protein